MMKAIQVIYNSKTDTIETDTTFSEKKWEDVCIQYNDDVHRIRDVHDETGYHALYECVDDNNKSDYYLVEESGDLHKLRRKEFYHKLGKP
ncbi:MAG: hypothetical protein HQK77_15660 [Desulfobacterales bacterium]|nr:hypothetical protein [Desulfobacterales bacterium]